MGNYYVLNGNLCAQGEIIMCSTGHYWGAQWEFRCSTGHYWGAQQDVRCSMGGYVLNGKLWCAQLDIIGVLNGNLSAQWEVPHRKLK